MELLGLADWAVLLLSTSDHGQCDEMSIENYFNFSKLGCKRAEG